MLFLYLLFLLLLPVDLTRVLSRPPPLFSSFRWRYMVQSMMAVSERRRSPAMRSDTTIVLEKWWREHTPLSKALLHVEHIKRVRAITHSYTYDRMPSWNCQENCSARITQ